MLLKKEDWMEVVVRVNWLIEVNYEKYKKDQKKNNALKE